MATFDLYSTVHKGLRALLFETAQHIGRTDFGDASAAVELAGAVRRTLTFLDEHALHEDERIMPAIRAKNPWTADELQSDHTRIEGLHRDVEQVLERLEQETSPSARESLGARLAVRFHRLVGEHLHHMEREERGGNRALWAHSTDEELQGIHGRIIADIGMQRLLQWAEFMLPAINPIERERMLAGLGAVVPEALLNVLGSGAKEVEA